MNRFLITLIGALLTFTAAHAFIDSYTIDRDKLPEDAQKMLTEHFPKAKVSMIKVDRHLLKKTDYDVKLTNGTKIEFSSKGKWTSVDCGKKALPESLVPSAIKRYVTKNYKDSKMVSIRKRNAGYDIGITGDRTLRFNLLHQFKGEVSTAEAQAEAEAEAQADDTEIEETVVETTVSE